MNIGDTLYGFCGGAFGRDSYQDKTIEAIGRDWVVVRSERAPLNSSTATRPS